MPVIIPHGSITPVASGTIQTCVNCHESARWDLRLLGSIESWCAGCILYKTEWGRGVASELAILVSKVEEQMSSKLTMDNGQLSVEGADRIMMSIVLISAYTNGKIYAGNRGPGS